MRLRTPPELRASCALGHRRARRRWPLPSSGRPVSPSAAGGRRTHRRRAQRARRVREPARSEMRACRAPSCAVGDAGLPRLEQSCAPAMNRCLAGQYGDARVGSRGHHARCTQTAGDRCAFQVRSARMWTPQKCGTTSCRRSTPRAGSRPTSFEDSATLARGGRVFSRISRMGRLLMEQPQPR
jgi:hypothetical protein